MDKLDQEFLERLSPAVQEAIRKDLIWKIRCFIHYASIKKDEEGSTKSVNESWGGW